MDCGRVECERVGLGQAGQGRAGETWSRWVRRFQATLDGYGRQARSGHLGMVRRDWVERDQARFGRRGGDRIGVPCRVWHYWDRCV